MSPLTATVIGERAYEEGLVRKPMDSRFRGNDVQGPSGRRGADHHSRFRGNDVNG